MSVPTLSSSCRLDFVRRVSWIAVAIRAMQTYIHCTSACWTSYREEIIRDAGSIIRTTYCREKVEARIIHGWVCLLHAYLLLSREGFRLALFNILSIQLTEQFEAATVEMAAVTSRLCNPSTEEELFYKIRVCRIHDKQRTTSLPNAASDRFIIISHHIRGNVAAIWDLAKYSTVYPTTQEVHLQAGVIGFRLIMAQEAIYYSYIYVLMCNTLLLLLYSTLLIYLTIIHDSVVYRQGSSDHTVPSLQGTSRLGACL